MGSEGAEDTPTILSVAPKAVFPLQLHHLLVVIEKCVVCVCVWCVQGSGKKRLSLGTPLGWGHFSPVALHYGIFFE